MGVLQLLHTEAFSSTVAPHRGQIDILLPRLCQLGEQQLEPYAYQTARGCFTVKNKSYPKQQFNRISPDSYGENR
jgi:hypothetical protein